METVNFKKSWNEVSISEFRQIDAILNSQMEDIDKHIAIASVLSDMNEEYFYELPFAELSALLAKIKFIEAEPKGVLRNTYTINGKKYDCLLNMKKMTASQYIDLQNYIKDGIDKNLGNILAIFLVPRKMKYGNGYDVAEVSKEILQYFNIADATTLSLFFSVLLKASATAILTYSKKQMKKELKKETDPERMRILTESMKMVEDSIRSGVGPIS